MAFYAGIYKSQRFTIPLPEARVYCAALPAAIKEEHARISRGGLPRLMTPEVVRELTVAIGLVGINPGAHVLVEVNTGSARASAMAGPKGTLWNVTYKVSNRVLLTLLRMPVFCALTYQEDVVRLAQTSRVALEPYVDFYLAFIRHIVTEYSTWCEDWCAERHAKLQLQEFYAEEFPDLAGTSDADRCWTCGVRPGCDWLGNDECYECFFEH